MGNKVLYNRRRWINDLKSAFTGSVVCHHVRGYNEEYTLELSDCNKKIRIHNQHLELSASKSDRRKNIKEFIRKLRVIRDELTSFIVYLEALTDG